MIIAYLVVVLCLEQMNKITDPWFKTGITEEWYRNEIAYETREI